MELNEKFLDELLKASITQKTTTDILIRHLGEDLLPNESYQAIWKEIRTFYTIERKLPTIGILSQLLDSEKDPETRKQAKHILSSMAEMKVHDVHDELIKQFEDYKKKLDFKLLFNEVADVYTKESKDKAIEMMAAMAPEIANFSLKNMSYKRVFKDFTKRQNERTNKEPDDSFDRIPTGIHEFDHYTRGGIKRGTSFLALGRSGTGKSTLLRWLAVNAARLGYRVVLFSLEGTEEETFEATDACWTATPMEKIEFGDIPEKKFKQIQKTINNVTFSGGEIYVKCAESFDSMSVEEARNFIIELEKTEGKIDLVLFDYLELFQIGGKYHGDSGERRRREMIANKMTDLAIELKVAVATAIQAIDINPTSFENEDFVMTRTHISEFKGAIKPFSYFITINQTSDEREQDVCRIYCDKFRRHRSGQTIRIAQDMSISRFYDSKRTLTLFWDIDKKIKKL
jgi:replicative DNA helicase